jgi:thiol-disulfide isomerase/thioredoxin
MRNAAAVAALVLLAACSSTPPAAKPRTRAASPRSSPGATLEAPRVEDFGVADVPRPPSALPEVEDARDEPRAAVIDAKWASDVGDIPFIVGRSKGMEVAAATGRPPMFYFTTTWCGFCRQLARTAFTDKDNVERVKEHFTPILLDGDDPDVAPYKEKYRVIGFPTVVFADMDGNQTGVVYGADAPAFKKTVTHLAP